MLQQQQFILMPGPFTQVGIARDSGCVEGSASSSLLIVLVCCSVPGTEEPPVQKPELDHSHYLHLLWRTGVPWWRTSPTG
jgi:hypothetical protein